jgi:hypothetical protein
MDTKQPKPVSGPLSQNLSYSVWDSNAEEGAAQGVPAGGNRVRNEEAPAGQETRNSQLTRDSAEFELL